MCHSFAAKVRKSVLIDVDKNMCPCFFCLLAPQTSWNFFLSFVVYFQHSRPDRGWCGGGERDCEGGHTVVRSDQRGKKKPCFFSFLR
jgi:hypothetical protein